MTRSCESCAHNVTIQENGRYEDVCEHIDHPGIQPDAVFLNGCSDWSMLRVRRANDGSAYQPKIHRRRIKDLYLIKEATGIPMTVLLDRAIDEIITRYTAKKRGADSSVE